MNLVKLLPFLLLAISISGINAVNSEDILVVSSASFIIEPVAADSLASAFSAGFGSVAAGHPLSVMVRDSTGREFSVSQFSFAANDQVNFLIPAEVANGISRIWVRNEATGTELGGSLTVRKTSPGLFTANGNGFGVPAAVVLRIKSDGTRVYESAYYFDRSLNRFEPSPIDVRNSPDTVYLILFGTGWRNHDKPTTPRVSIGRVEIIPQYLGAQGDFPGLDQCNVRLPRNLREGKDTVKLNLECFQDSDRRIVCLETQPADVEVFIR